MRVPRGAKQSSGLSEAPEGRVGSLPPAPRPAASPSGLCPRGRCASARSRRVWAGGARAGASPLPRCRPRRRYCCHGPAAPSATPRLRLGILHAAPRPWRTSAWSRPPRVSRALGPSSSSDPRVVAAPGLEPLLAGRLTRWMDAHGQ